MTALTVDEVQTLLRVSPDDAVLGSMLIAATELLKALSGREPDRSWVLRLVAHWYDWRGIAVIGGKVPLLPDGLAQTVSDARRCSC